MRRLRFAALCALCALAPDVPSLASAVGVVDNGRLSEAAELPVRGPHHYILPRRHRARNLRYATRELVSLVQEAAAAVARRYPGARLGVGNLARRQGGRIRYSISHQSGLDADLAFYMRDARGRVAHPSDLIHFGPQGRSRPGFRFDVARNWALVEALLAAKGVAIQYLLISAPLRTLLLAHGKSIGAPPELLERATEVLHQPRWAQAHDDHLHVRIFCPPADLPRGCKDSGPERSWRLGVTGALPTGR